MTGRYLIGLCLVLLLLAGGCLASDDWSKSAVPSVDVFDREAGTSQSISYGEAYGTAAPVPAATYAGDTAIDQKLIKTGSIRIEVSAVAESTSLLKTIAESHGGYLSSSSFSRGASDQLTATATLRIPGDAFDGAVAEIRAIGKVLSESISAQDVTEEYVDLTAQKNAKTRQLDQYYRILEKAQTVEEILKVQVEIERVQVELDRLEGRLRYLDSRVDFATLTVYLQEPAPLGGDGGHSFIEVINEGIAGFLFMVDTLIILFFMVLPLLILGGLVYVVYRWRKRTTVKEKQPSGGLEEPEKKGP